MDTGTGEYRRDRDADAEKPCGCWACPVCGPVRQRRHVGHFVDVFSELGGVFFATLTLDPKTGLDESVSRKYVQHVWSKWRKRLRRLCLKRGSSLRFMRVIEYQTNGQAHVHAILSAEALTGDEIAGAWFASGGGVVCDVQALDVDADRADLARRVGYVVKYALKDATAPGAPRGRHYVETSEGIGYGSAAAIASRAAYVAANAGEYPDADQDLDPDRVRVWEVDAARTAPPPNPDTVTAADLATFAALALDARSAVYRTQDGNGEWWEIRQHDDGTRTRRRRGGYRSLYQERLEAAAASPPT